MMSEKTILSILGNKQRTLFQKIALKNYFAEIEFFKK